MAFRAGFLLTILACISTVAAVGPVPARATPAAEAEALYRHALDQLSRNSIEARRVAVRDLERATLLDPTRADLQLELGQTYFRIGFLRQARLRFETVQRLDASRPEAAIGLGEVWRRDYLKYLDRSSLARAIGHFSNAARQNPGQAGPWLRLAPLQYEQGERDQAMTSAEQALGAEPGRAEALLAVAELSYRLGRVARADSAFRAVIPRLPLQVRERFEDIAPVSSEADTATLRRLPEPEKPEFLRRFWAENDPDPVTPENEAQLEYWSRVAQAYFLYYNPRRQEWDERGEFYVRYGPPEAADYNPVGTRLNYSFSTGPDYPMNALVWNYPGLGMSITMEDRLLSEYYLPPITRRPPTGREPDPEVLAKRTDVLATRGGRGVFPILPPGVAPRPANGVIARFEGEAGLQIAGFVETSGSPADTLWAEWVLLDSARVEVARLARSPDPSPCDPATRRVADFASPVPPGDYLAGLSVRDARGRRGVVRQSVHVNPPRPTVELSDIVLSCGAPLMSPPGTPPAIRLTPNAEARVGPSQPLTVYFETYHLRPDHDGLTRFEFEYTVRSLDRDSRSWIQRLLSPRAEIPAVSATRREEQAGTLRRQSVSIPVQNLPDGRYRLEIRVRDLVSNGEARGAVDFAKGPVATPGDVES